MKENRWIGVSEKEKPDFGVAVNVVDRDGDIFLAYYEDSEDIFICQHDAFNTLDITHWIAILEFHK